jgi:2-methylcitrate dehydratase PrpD
MSQTAKVAQWVADLQWEDLPADVIHQAKRCVRDFIGCAVGGTETAVGQIAVKAALEWGGPAEATVIGSEQGVAARHAAFANSTLANALDFDDTLHGHHGATTCPTALAAGEKWPASGKALLLAIIAGYELSARALILLQPIIPRFESMWDLGTLQAYGACAAAARIAGLSAGGVENALGLVSGTSVVPLPRKQRLPGEGRTMLKAAYGWASDAAIVAVQMTAAGFVGPSRALDDNLGFWREVASESFGLSSFADQLGSFWSILQVEFKPYMACRFLHPVLQGVEALRGRHNLASSVVKKVDVRAFSLLGDEHHYILRPPSGIDAQYSLPYTVAALLHAGHLSAKEFDAAALKNQAILELAERVHFDVDPAIDSAYPSRLGAQVRISTVDGQVYETIVEHPKGSPSQPLSDVELADKFYSLVVPSLGQARADELSALVDRLEKLPNLDPMCQVLRAPQREAVG